MKSVFPVAFVLLMFHYASPVFAMSSDDCVPDLFIDPYKVFECRLGNRSLRLKKNIEAKPAEIKFSKVKPLDIAGGSIRVGSSRLSEVIESEYFNEISGLNVSSNTALKISSEAISLAYISPPVVGVSIRYGLDYSSEKINIVSDGSACTSSDGAILNCELIVEDAYIEDAFILASVMLNLVAVGNENNWLAAYAGVGQTRRTKVIYTKAPGGSFVEAFKKNDNSINLALAIDAVVYKHVQLSINHYIDVTNKKEESENNHSVLSLGVFFKY